MDTNELLAIGEKYYNNKQFDLAIDFLSQFLQQDPKNPKAYNNRGQAYQNLEKFDEAILDFTKAIEFETDQDNAENEQINFNSKTRQLGSILISAYFNRGTTYADQEKYELALQDFSKVLELDQNDAQAYNSRGTTYDALNRFDEAIQDYTKAIQLDSNYNLAYQNRGIAYKNQAMYKEAIQDCSKAISLDPNDASGYTNRGNVYYDTDMLNEAIKDFSKAIELDPNDAKSYNNRGNAYWNQKKYELALKNYSKALQLDSNCISAYNNRGTIYLDLKKFEEAIQDFSKVIQLEQNNFEAYYNRGLAYNALNKLDEAMQDYTKYLSQNPGDPDTLLNIATIFIVQQNHQQAQINLENAQNTFNTFDEETLMTKFDIMGANLASTKEKMLLLQELDKKYQELTLEVQQLQKKNGLNQKQDKKFRETQSHIVQGLLQANINTNLKKLVMQLNEGLFNIKQELESLKQQKRKIIITTLNQYTLPQNQHKLIYYRSFCSRLLVFIEAFLQIETDLNSEKVQEANLEKLAKEINQNAEKTGSLLSTVPIIDSVIEISLHIIGYGIGCYKEKKFQDKINEFNTLIRQKSGEQAEREQDVQIASFKILDKVKQEDFNPINFKFEKIASQIAKTEQKQKLQYSDDPFWLLGIDHSLITLNYLVEHRAQIISDENIDFVNIILQSLNKYDQKEQQKLVEQNRESSCCQIY